MRLSTNFYQVIQSHGGEDHVLFMHPDLDRTIGAFLALGGHISPGNEAWVKQTLRGRTRTTDGYEASRNYTGGRGGLRVEHHALTPDLALVTESHIREAQSKKLAPKVLAGEEMPRRRRRPT